MDTLETLVTPAQLAGLLGRQGTVVVDATLPPVGVANPPDTHARYLAGHIPGAVFFDIEALSDHTTSLPHMLPSTADFASAMSALGVSDRDTIVVYEQEGVFSAPRAWWMLRTFGATSVHLLDGGLRAWTDAGRLTESGEPSIAPAEFHAHFDPAAVKDFAAMQQLLSQQAQVLDARSAGRFSGAAPEPRVGLSSGHMPGATSIPFVELVDAGRMKSPDALREVFRSKNIDLSRPITTTCGSGVTAAVISLGLHLAGAGHVSLYDGSWAEYAQHPAAVINKPA